MFHTIADFIQIWQEESKNTEKILEALNDQVLNTEIVPGYRTIGGVAWHILKSPRALLEKTGLHIKGPDRESIPPDNQKAIIQEHQTVVNSVVHHIQTHWNNRSLHEKDLMFGRAWTRDQTLTSLLLHLIHHRGQLTVLMRLAGLKVPGIYGPSKEEGEALGLQLK